MISNIIIGVQATDFFDDYIVMILGIESIIFVTIVFWIEFLCRFTCPVNYDLKITLGWNSPQQVKVNPIILV